MISVQQKAAGAKERTCERTTKGPCRKSDRNESLLRAEKALCEACLLGRLGFVAALLDMGVSVDARNEDGDTPLMHAAVQGNPKIVQLLLAADADVEAQNPYGITALMEAAFWGNVEVVELLLQHGASLTCRDRAGRNALQWATKGDRKEVIDFLFSRRNQQRDEFLRSEDKGGSTKVYKGSDFHQGEGIGLLKLQ